MEFPSTQWTLLAQATLHGDSTAAGAMAEFIRRYRGPVVQFIRARGWPVASIEDLAHDFLLHVMEKSTLRRADANRGRFRSFLLGALVRFLGDVRDRQTAVKRGGNVAPLSLDAAAGGEALAATPPPDAETFDRQWALGLLTLAVSALEADFAGRGRTADFAILRAYLPGGIHPPAYDEAAQRLGLSLPAFKTEVHRLRERFRAGLRAEVAATVSSFEQVDDEIAYLGRVLNQVVL